MQMDNRQWSAWCLAIMEVVRERCRAMDVHGPLKPGYDRWSRLLAEEWQEVEDELQTLQQPLWDNDKEDAKQRLKEELAQLAQLAIGMIEILQQEEEATRGKQ